ncbi:MAG: YidC/Oxa1 family membrane protein insertase [Parcubacteria group bacterium]|nr:YidC/Oxa1 family membrane protein insertase [Parcubacteria group bacterium]
MMELIWQHGLIWPLFNVLIYLYNTAAFQNLGMAIVEFTLLVRILLFPLSIISEQNQQTYDSLKEELAKLDKDYQLHEVAKREAQRRLFRKYKISPWANVLLLLFQGFVLLILYQVFVRGFNLTDFPLYSWVERPENLDKSFLGWFDISRRNAIVSGVAAFFIWLHIMFSFHGKKLTRSDILFRNYFPFVVFFALWWLPSAKALFITTSLVASYGIHFASLAFRSEKEKHTVSEPSKRHDDDLNPLDRLRKK